jgi:hypothetical protein
MEEKINQIINTDNKILVFKRYSITKLILEKKEIYSRSIKIKE